MIGPTSSLPNTIIFTLYTFYHFIFSHLIPFFRLWSRRIWAMDSNPCAVSPDSPDPSNRRDPGPVAGPWCKLARTGAGPIAAPQTPFREEHA